MSLDSRSDAELIETFGQGADGAPEAHEAFAALVARHGGMVYSTCLRVLRDPAAAEDAAQAAFLVLARRPRAVRLGVGAFLHGTAFNIARRAREAEQLRRHREKESAQRRPEPGFNPLDAAASNDLRHVLDEALQGLPRRQRETVLMHFLGGWTQEDVASALGISRSAVATHVQLGIEKLRRRLARLGAAVSTAVLAGLLRESATACPATLQQAAPHLAAAAAPGAAALLARAEVSALFWYKAKLAGVGVAAVILASGGFFATSRWVSAKDAAAIPLAQRDASPRRTIPDGVLDVWGGGQLLAFSGVDGPTPYHQALVFRTTATGTGIEAKIPDQAILLFDDAAPRRAFLTGDVFDLEHAAGRTRGAFLDATHLLIEGPCRVLSAGKGLNVVAAGNRTLVAAADRCDPRRVGDDLNQAVSERLRWIQTIPAPAAPDGLPRRTLWKCLSVIKAAVYSPEGRLRHYYTTPDRWPHRGLWLADSAYHAIGLRHIDPKLARDAIEAVLDTQYPDGMIPISYIHQRLRAPFTHAPVLAMAAQRVYRSQPQRDFLDRIYPKLAAYLDWDMKNRDADGDGLLEWALEDDPACRSGESDWDNSPRFDVAKLMNAIDFSALLAVECEVMSEFARLLGKPDEADRWAGHHRRLCRSINETLWNETLGIYVDALAHGGGQQPLLTAAGFLPLLCGAPSPEQARRLAGHLRDPKTFATALPVASVSPSQREHYAKDMWRGPVWAHANWLVAEGFERYGLSEEARLLRARMLAAIEKYYQHAGVIFEFFDDEDVVPPPKLFRKRKNDPSVWKHQVIHDYQRTAALYVDWRAAEGR